MNTSNDSDGVMPHGGYENLRSYKVASAVYDATVVFCRRFYPDDRRMTDQMVQAARSGVRNISEGSGTAATSRKGELKLTNVARASLSDELLRDYEAFLRQRGLQVWEKNSRQALEMRSRLRQDRVDVPVRPDVVRLTGLFGLAEFVEKAAPELAANAMLCVVNQAAYLLRRQMESQATIFVKEGGFTERLYEARKKQRASDRSDKSDRSDEKPLCPQCGRPMVLRTARKGAKAGQPFWGCSGFPDCRATREAAPQ